MYSQFMMHGQKNMKWRKDWRQTITHSTAPAVSLKIRPLSLPITIIL